MHGAYTNINELNKKPDTELLEYYKKLGYNDNQSKLLSSITYGDEISSELCKAYNEARSKRQYTELFEDSIVGFLSTEQNKTKSEQFNVVQLYRIYLGLDTEQTIKQFNTRHRPSLTRGSVQNISAQCLSVNMATPLRAMMFAEADDIECEECYIESCDTENTGIEIHSAYFDESKEHITIDEPLSYFKATCNTASADDVMYDRIYDITRTNIRKEEFLNWFQYDLNSNNGSNDSEPIVSTVELLRNTEDSGYVFIGLKGIEYEIKKQNIVILLDVSGSMAYSAEHTQASIFTVISKLKSGDKLSIVTYSSDDAVVINSLTINKDDKQQFSQILSKLMQVVIGGCTNGSAGLRMAYNLIKSNCVADGINRIVLLTDGDFNFGSCNVEDIKQLILENREAGAYMSVIGTGGSATGFGNDEIAETIAKNGNGNYCTVNSIESIDRHINFEYNKLINTVALDVKIQVEFNPLHIKSYKLLGYENRALTKTEFNDTKTVAEPFGSGAQCIALYEVEFEHDSMDTFTGRSYLELRYVVRQITPNTLVSNELLTLKVSYKEEDSKEIKEYISHCSMYNAKATDNIKKAYVVNILCDMLKKKYVSKEDKELITKFIGRLKNKDIDKLVEIVNKK